MEETKAASAAMPATESWAQVPWRKLEHHVYRIQKRIYKAQLAGNQHAVRSLQRLLMKSEAARTIAVRRVSQDNQGKRTAGSDGIASLDAAARNTLVDELAQPEAIAPQPTRRVWIPKPGKDEQRPLGIPVMRDRAHQALVKLALEPQWEARFEENSYGFRPGRSCHDAIGALFNYLKASARYVVDADIKGCFDNIDHSALLARLDTPATIRHAVKGWLRAGVLDGTTFAPTTSGTPQGGVISPLLANIALHGLEAVARTSHRMQEKGHTHRPVLIRYADDFVILCRDREGAEAARAAVGHPLARMGLLLHAGKTRIVHTQRAAGGHAPGFDFLGFNVRNYPVGKYHSGKNNRGELVGQKLLIKPSEEAVKRHTAELGQAIRSMRTATQAALIKALSLKIRGWSAYYRTVVAKEVLHDCDHVVYSQLRRWARRRHPTKNAPWVARRYWAQTPGNKWDFLAREDGETIAQLLHHDATPIRRHSKVRGEASPFDGNLTYWAQRLVDHPLTRGEEASLLRRQRGYCPHCKLLFREGELREIDHIIRKEWGGTNSLANKQVLHRHCHDQKTARELRTGNTAGGLQ